MSLYNIQHETGPPQSGQYYPGRGEVFKSDDSHVDAESQNSQEMALRMMDKLLREPKPYSGQRQMNFLLMQKMLLVANKYKVTLVNAFSNRSELYFLFKYIDYLVLRQSQWDLGSQCPCQSCHVRNILIPF